MEGLSHFFSQPPRGARAADMFRSSMRTRKLKKLRRCTRGRAAGARGAGVCTRRAGSSSGADRHNFTPPFHPNKSPSGRDRNLRFFQSACPCTVTLVTDGDDSWLYFHTKMLTACSFPEDPPWASGFRAFVFLVSWGTMAFISHPLSPV